MTQRLSKHPTQAVFVRWLTLLTAILAIALAAAACGLDAPAEEADTATVAAATAEPIADTAATSEAMASAASWVGETNIDGRVTFIRVGPQIFASPEPFFHRPNDLVFNQELQNLSVDDSTMSFTAVDGDLVFAFEGAFDGDHYSGMVQGAETSGTFSLYPAVAIPASSLLNSYSGTYELGDGVYRTVGYEDLAGLVETRLYYSDGENFVLLYPLSAAEYLTGSGERIRFEQENRVVTGMTIADADGERLAPKVQLYAEEDIAFESGDGTIAGTLMIPDTPGPHPAVIIAHSSGGGERHAFWLYASQFAQDGIAVLAYDRRGHGTSTGGAPFNRDTNILAEDMKAGYAYLQSHTEIDPQRIGLMGHSNGSWVAPRAAQDLPDVAFISVSMASAVSQVEAELFRHESVLRAVGVSEESIAQAMEALVLYYKGGVSSFTEAEQAEFMNLYEALLENEELQNAQGFDILPTNTPLDAILDMGGSVAYMEFSPADFYLTTDVPVSFYLGELDENISPDLTIAAMEEVIAQRPDADISLVVFPDATHNLYVLPAPVLGISQDFLYPNLASYKFAPGYIEQQRVWLKEKNGLN